MMSNIFLAIKEKSRKILQLEKEFLKSAATEQNQKNKSLSASLS